MALCNENAYCIWMNFNINSSASASVSHFIPFRLILSISLTSILEKSTHTHIRSTTKSAGSCSQTNCDLSKSAEVCKHKTKIIQVLTLAYAEFCLQRNNSNGHLMHRTKGKLFRKVFRFGFSLVLIFVLSAREMKQLAAFC